MPRLSRKAKSIVAVLAGVAAIIGISGNHHAATQRTATLRGGTSSSTQNKGGNKSSSTISGSSKEYAQICYDPATGQRLENDACKDTDEQGGGSSGSSSGGSHAGGRWYWVQSSDSGKIPKTSEKVSGGTTTRPSDGTIFRNLPSKGGSFAESFRESKSSYTVENSKVKGSRSGGSHGGFGGGSKTGGGTKGG